MLRRPAIWMVTLMLLAATAAARGESSSSAEPVGIDVVVRPAEAASAGPRLEQVFKSMHDNARAESSVPMMPAALAVAAVVLMGVAISQWNRRRAIRPRPTGDHRRLLDEVARASGLSRRQLKRLESAARAGGLSSPIVAAICPSVLLKRAGEARSATERSMWAALSRQVARGGRR